MLPALHRRAPRTRLFPALLLGVAAALAPVRAAAQLLPVGDVWEDYLRVLDAVGGASLGSNFVRPLAIRRVLAGVPDTLPHPWRRTLAPPSAQRLFGGAELVLADPGLRSFLNTSRPYGANEGAVWVGRGVTAAVDAGATLRWGRTTLTVHPTLAFAQNRAFELAPVTRPGGNRYAYPWRSIDLPQRFGPTAIWTLDPGQSSARTALGPVTVGVGTESLWWGPGLRNAILMSNNAPGFAHALLESSRPLSVGIGTVEGQWIWGRLSRSRWFDTTSADPGRFVTGAVLAFSPKWLAGLHLGVGRLFYGRIPEGGVPWSEALVVFQGVRKETLAAVANPGGEDRRDQMFSSFARWVLPASGVELWGEWARADHGWNFRDYYLEPEHSSGYTIGLRKVAGVGGNRLLVLESELTSLGRSTTSRVRDVPTFYAHHLVYEGYTQRGRVIGAAVGPGGNAQYAGVKMYAPWGRAGVFAERRVLDNDAYYAQAEPGEWCCHAAFLDVGAEGLTTVRDLEISASGTISREFNRYFRSHSDHWNLGLRLESRWRGR